MALERIRQEYAGQAPSEWERLCSTPITRIEYLITRHCLERYLPGTGLANASLPEAGLILDAGSGPGRYAIALAQQGYRVATFDLLREMLGLARVNVTEAGVDHRAVLPVEGDIATLPYADDTFDGVISLGAPLSHLTEPRARRSAVQEMARVAKPGGIVFLTGLTRLAAYRSTVYWSCYSSSDRFVDPQVRASGIVRGSHTWYLFAVGELEALARSAGLEIVERVGCEGLAAHLPMDHLEQLEADPQRGPVWREILLQTCNEPTIIGVSNHLLVISRKAETPRLRSG